MKHLAEDTVSILESLSISTRETRDSRGHQLLQFLDLFSHDSNLKLKAGFPTPLHLPMRRCEDISIYEVSEKKTKDPFQMLEILGNQQHLKGENNLRPSTSPISSTFTCLSCSHEFSKPKPKMASSK